MPNHETINVYPRRNTRRAASAGAVIAATALVLAACSSDDAASDEPETTSADSAPAETTPAETTPADTTPADATPATDAPAPTTDVAAAAAETESADEPREYDFSAIAPVVDQVVADTGISGAGLIVVERDDGVVHEEYWGDFAADRISMIASSSKMISAGVLLNLQDQGLLDIDAPLTESVEWGTGNPDVTVAQLLSNSSGLVGLAPDPAYGPYICQFLGTELEECGELVFTTPDDDADVIAADTEFRYGGAQWQVAGAVAESVSGKSWAELIDEIYVQPCALDVMGYNNHYAAFSELDEFGYPVAFGGDVSTLTPTDNPSVEGGVYSDTGDYAELLLMHLRGGMCGDTQVLSQDALDTMHADRVAEVYGAGAGEAGTGYGMGWWVDRETGIISDAGLYGAYPWLDLEDGYGAYLVVEANGDVSAQLREPLLPLVDEAILAAR